MGQSLFYHPETEEERETVKKNMMYFRSIGDMEGFWLCMAMLSGKKNEVEEVKETC